MDLPKIELKGTPRIIGQVFGECCREEIQAPDQIRLDSVITFAEKNLRAITREQILDVAAKCLKPTEEYDPIGYEDFTGIAHGANLALEQCYVLQGLTDLRDVRALDSAPDGEGCSSLILGSDRSTTSSIILAQSWDLQTSNMPYVRLVHR